METEQLPPTTLSLAKMLVFISAESPAFVSILVIKKNLQSPDEVISLSLNDSMFRLQKVCSLL